MSYQQCLDVIREAGGELTDTEIEQLAEELQRRQKLNMASGKFIDSEEAALAAAQKMGKDMKLAAAIAKREAADNEVKFLKAVSYLDSQWDGSEGRGKGEGIASLLYSSNKVADSGRRSVMGYQNGTKAKLMGAFMSDMLKIDKSVPDMLASGQFDLHIMRAMYAIRKGDTPTGPEFVPQIAQALVKHQDYWRNLKNENGAWIGQLDDYIVSRSHSPTLIKNAGFDAWKADIEGLIDWQRTLESMPDKDPTEFLANVYKGLAYGHHLKSGDDKGGFTGPSNLAKKLSQERVLHFKGPDEEHAYMTKYATGGLSFNTVMALEHTSQSVGLMKVLGANPGNMVQKLIDHANKTTPTGLSPMEVNTIRTALASVDGTMKTPVSDLMARVTTYTLAAQSMSKLGGALLAQFGDLATRIMEFKRQGMGPLEAVSSHMGEFLGGTGGDARKEALLDIAGITDALTAEMSRATAVDPVGGTVAKMQDTFFRLTGMHHWQQSAEGSAAVMMAQNLARQTAKDFGALPDSLQVLLRQHGIGEAEWGVIRQGSATGADGLSYLSPQSPKSLSNDALLPLVQKDIDALHERTQATIDSLNEKIGKEAEWQATRKTKLDEYNAKLADMLNRFMGTRDKRLAERADYVDAYKELTQARMERAAAEADIAAYLAAEKQQNQIKGFLDAVEEGKRPEKLHPNVDRNVQRNIRESGSRGQQLGEKIGRAERRITELEQNLRSMERTFDAETKAKFEELTAKLEARSKEMDDFVTASVERQARYADLVNQWESSVTRKEQRIFDKAREELSDRMYNFFSDRVGFAAIKPDAKTRAMMLQGTQPGTWLGSGLRLVTQFKSFPIAFLQKALGASMYGSGANTMGQAIRSPKAMGDTAQLFLMSTVMGYMSMVAKDLVKGREPRDPTDPRTMMAAIQQGGGMGIYGDFLFGESKSRTGGTLVSTLAGPTLSTLDDMTDIWRRIRNGDDAAAKAFSTALSVTPYMNVFYLRPVLDYMILNSLTEAMNPGALRRREALITQQNEQGWLMRPSQNYADPFGLTR